MKKLFIGVAILALFSFVLISQASACTNEQNNCNTWNVTGNWVIDFVWNGGSYPNDVTLTQTGNNISGTIGWPSGSNPYLVIGTVSGTVDNNGSISLIVQYNDRSYIRTMTGTIDPNGYISGLWNDANPPANDNGTWTSISGVAKKSYCNHGQYVRWQENKREAAHSRFGMPEQSRGHENDGHGRD